MSENTKIQWADHTFNPWIGCAKVSPGCAHCYAETLMDTRWGKVKWGKGQPRLRTSAVNWKQPLKWNKNPLCVDCGTPFRDTGVAIDCECGQIGAIGKVRRPRVFCSSLADWLDDEVPIEWLAELLRLIHDTPNLDWLLLTKRLENWDKRMREVRNYGLHPAGEFSVNAPAGALAAMWLQGNSPANVWLGTSVEDQQRADERIPKLLRIPARVRFLSVEPLLGPVTIAQHPPSVAAPGLDWAIIGGESGQVARPCDVSWVRSLVEQCRAAGVAPFVKQLGSVSKSHGFDNHHADKKGGNPEEWSADLRLREFPAQTL